MVNIYNNALQHDEARTQPKQFAAEIKPNEDETSPLLSSVNGVLGLCVRRPGSGFLSSHAIYVCHLARTTRLGCL